MPESARDKLSETKSALIIDIEMGIYYHGLREAAVSLGLNRNTLKGWLYGKCKNGKNKSNLRYA